MRLTTVLCVLALLLCASGIVLAQNDFAGDGVYSVTYFDNNIPRSPVDATIRIINPGVTGSPISADEGLLCANLYVFDESQEMLECCSCPITANGLLTISVQELTDNPLTVCPFRGVVKLVASFPSPACDPTKIVLNDPPNLRGVSTHVQSSVSGVAPINNNNSPLGYLAVTEDEFADAPLSAVEQADLGTICSFVRYLGTGRGKCDEVCDEIGIPGGPGNPGIGSH